MAESARNNARLVASCYGPYMAAIYDAAMADAAMPTISRAVALAMKRFNIVPKAIVDVGCGTGQLLASLHLPGLRMIGVDRAAAMLAVAQRRLGPHRACLLHQDLRALALPECVDLILCTFATLNYMLRSADLDAAFAGFARNLHSGGHLILDYIPHRAQARARARTRQVIRFGDMLSTWDIAIDAGRGLTQTRIAFRSMRGGPERIEHHLQRWHRPALMGTLLRRHGFVIRGVRPLGPGGPRPWRQIVARRTPKPEGIRDARWPMPRRLRDTRRDVQR